MSVAAAMFSVVNIKLFQNDAKILLWSIQYKAYAQPTYAVE